MPNTISFSLLLTIFLATPLIGQTPIDRIQPLIPGLNARQVEDRAEAQKQCESICLQAGAPDGSTRGPLCQAIGNLLQSDRVRPPAKIFLIKQLERIGRSESLPALKAMLEDERRGIRDAARRALANNPEKEATKILIDHCKRQRDFIDKKSTINALGYRSDSSSVAFLTDVANQSKGPLRAAAINAISKSATDQLSPNVLRGIQDKDALLRFADGLADQGKPKKAMAIYRNLANSPDSPFALAGLRGMLKLADSKTAVAKILDSLANGPKQIRQVAIAEIREISPDAIQLLSDQFASQSEETQRAIVLALGTRSDGAGRDMVTTAAEFDNESLRRTAVEALGGIGDASSIAVLVPLLDTDDQDIASASIMRLRGDGVDEKLVAELNSATSMDGKSGLLRLLLARRATIALTNFQEAAGSSNAALRDIGISALSRLGEPHHINAILSAHARLSGSDRDRAEKQLVNMCRRIPKATEVLSDRFRQADQASKLQLVSILGRVGGDSALESIRGLLGSSDSKSHEAAVAALANWPNHDVAEDLKQVAAAAKSDSQRIRALRGLARVSVLGGDDANKLDYLRFVFANATRAEEKNLALDRAKAVRTVESLKFVLPHIEDPDLGARAQRTVVDLAHHRGLREPNRSEFEPALQRVAQLLTDKRQQERVRKYLANE